MSSGTIPESAEPRYPRECPRRHNVGLTGCPVLRAVDRPPLSAARCLKRAAGQSRPGVSDAPRPYRSAAGTLAQVVDACHQITPLGQPTGTTRVLELASRSSMTNLVSSRYVRSASRSWAPIWQSQQDPSNELVRFAAFQIQRSPTRASRARPPPPGDGGTQHTGNMSPRHKPKPEAMGRFHTAGTETHPKARCCNGE